MELIKRKIILSGLTTSGNTIFPEGFIQPDYFIGVHLTQKYEDIGLYTDLEGNLDIDGRLGQLGITGLTGEVILSEYEGTVGSNGEIVTTGTSENIKLDDFVTKEQYIVTGETDSRLNEVKTFKLNNVFEVNKPQVNNKWIRNISVEQGTNREFIEYTITPIDYKTFTDNGETTYMIPSLFLPQNSQFFTPPILSGWNESNSTLLPSIKEEIKMGLVQEPTIESEELFMDRKELSVFESHLRLNEIIGVTHLEGYSRKFFNIDKQ